MRIFIISLLLFVSTIPVVSGAELYTCPMHPHIEGEAGDTCPICGMALVPKAGTEEEGVQVPGSDGASEDANAVSIDPEFVQALGIKTIAVEHHGFGEEIRAPGIVSESTRQQHLVDLRTNGWIVDLHADAVGEPVKKGDLLFTVYGPDLMAAQSDYLIGGRAGNAEQRLRQFGMDDQAIAVLRERGTMMSETPFFSPVDGTVTGLNARNGAYIAEGQTVLKLTDLSTVWVNASVAPRDLEFLAIGAPARVRLPDIGQEYATTVDFIHPTVDPVTRTATVRLTVPNPGNALKPEAYVDVILNGRMESRLAVPAEAILHGPDHAYVFEALGDGRFRPVPVETGVRAAGLIEIVAGLDHGQNIVASGQFLIDAEANLKSGMAGMDHAGGAAEASGSMAQPVTAQEHPGHVH